MTSRSSGRNRSNGRGWYGDEDEHSQASREGQNRRGGRRSSDYDEDDDYSRSSRGRSGSSRSNEGRGWYGDEEGHSEAAREGWEHRSGGRRSSDYDEDDDYSRSSRGRGGSSRSNEGRGWYGDEEGHSEAAREGWEHRRGGRRSSRDYDEDDDYSRSSRSRGGSSRSNEGRGWYGDEEGHSEAAREGWEHRSGGRRSSDYDDDEDNYSRSSRSRGGSSRNGGSGRGWYGDEEEHSRASRKGWRNRD